MEDIELTLPVIADGEDKSSALKNCLRNNYRHLRKWAKRTNTDCFRLYDREIAHYPLAIDLYAGRFCVHYYSRSREQEEPPQELVEETEKAICTLFGTKAGQIFWRIRAKRKETRQYEKAGNTKAFFTVKEHGVKFHVNLTDYLDTGLFMDHRETRKLVASTAAGKKVLNLFAYTCSFSVQAAAAGAVYTKSVDMSNTYTDWGRANFTLNDLSTMNNNVVRADCLKFLNEELRTSELYDIIIIDPPTISRSKKMEQMFDVHVEYIPLIQKSLKLLMKDGSIYFSTNSRKFHFDETQFSGCTIAEITHKTLPVDFKDPKIHRCWKISKG